MPYEDQNEYRDDDVTKAPNALASASGLRAATRRSPIDLDAGILGNNSRDGACAFRQPAAEVPLLEIRDYVLVQNPARSGVRNHRFKPVADLDPNLPVLNGRDEQDAVVLPFASYTPALKEAIGEVLNFIAFQGGNSDNGHLARGLALELSQELLEILPLFRPENACEVVHVAGRAQALG